MKINVKRASNGYYVEVVSNSKTKTYVEVDDSSLKLRLGELAMKAFIRNRHQNFKDKVTTLTIE